MTVALIAVLALGWLLAATIGTMAYFANEPSANKMFGYKTNKN
jgi:hypothetical protein